jgi:hypothetical protein
LERGADAGERGDVAAAADCGDIRYSAVDVAVESPAAQQRLLHSEFATGWPSN